MDHHQTGPCPQCETPTQRQFEDVRKDAVIWSYTCPTCGHVWVVATPRLLPDARRPDRT
jgi:hypothetical protein